MRNLTPPVGSALERLKATLDSKSPELQVEHERRYAELRRSTQGFRLKSRDAAAPYIVALHRSVRKVRAARGTRWDEAECLARLSAQHLCSMYARETTEVAFEAVRQAIRRFGRKAVHLATIDLLRERPSNIKEPLGVLLYRAGLFAKALQRKEMSPDAAGAGGRGGEISTASATASARPAK